MARNTRRIKQLRPRPEDAQSTLVRQSPTDTDSATLRRCGEQTLAIGADERAFDKPLLQEVRQERPEVVMSVEERARARDAKKAARKEARHRARVEGDERPPGGA